jgi:serine/threonine-protein kinase
LYIRLVRPGTSHGCLDENLVYQLVDGKVSPKEAAEAERHAATCPECTELIAWVRRDLRNPAEITTAVGGPTHGAQAAALLTAVLSDREDLAGQTIASKYRLGKRLGAGGMGVVYEAVNTWTDRRVALKLLHPWFSSDDETVQRFHHEAKNASRIAHPNIVDVLDLGQDPRDGSLYMVQEFLTGPTLRQHVAERGRLPVAETAGILRPIMDALAAAHDAGVVHRDVKPENIILSTDRSGQSVPKLIDFGISKITEGEVAVMLQTGPRAVGTPLYMSPEQLRANQTIDRRTDVWAVGVVLFELLAGHRPFEADSHAEVAVRILTGEPPSLAQLAPGVPTAVSEVIARALARERDARFRDLREMADAFDAAVAAPAVERASASPALARRSRWLRARWLLAPALVIVAASVAGAIRAQRHRQERTSPAVAPASPTVVVAPAPAPPVAAPSTPEPPAGAAPASPARPVSTTRRRVNRHREPAAKADPVPASPSPPPPVAKHAPLLDP